MPKVAIQLVIWNGKNFLEKAITSIGRQTFRDFELLVLDNGSTDGSRAEAERLLGKLGVPHRFFRNEENDGFAGGHNFLFKQSQSEFVFCVNQDIELAPDYLEKVMAQLESEPKAASAAGLLLKENGEVDSAGLARTAYGKFFDVKEKGEGVKKVFGVSGALPVYRRSAALLASTDGNLFDNSYFSYKEDVDLAWRLKIIGFDAYTVFSAVATHIRGFGPERRGRDLAWRQRFSSRNHLLLLVKDLPGREFWKIPGLIVYEGIKALYLLIFMPAAVSYLAGFFRMLPDSLKKRKVFWSRLKREKK